MTTRKRLSTSAKQTKTPSSWAEAVEAITINDDHWWCMMTMIVETVPSQARLIELFEEAAENGSRRAIHVLTFKKLMSSVKALSKIDEDKCPVAQGVFHQASRLIARGENLEAWLMARLVKYLVYRAKMETMARAQRETDIEHEADRSIRALLTATNVESQRSMKSAKTKDSDRGFEVSFTSKPNTNLRKRGEDKKGKVYMDDAPENGPHLFIILTGFHDPNFPLELIKAGLPLFSVLKIKNPGETFVVTENSEINLEKDNKAVERKKSIFGKLTEQDLAQFWVPFEKSLNDWKTLEAYSSLISRNFCPPEIPSNDDHEEVEKYKKDLYDRLSYIVYDLHDLQSLHVEYIRSMKLLHIPEEPPGVSNIYTTIMNTIPAECSFVSVILQAMIAQVEANVPNEQPLNQSAADSKNISESNEESSLGEESGSKIDVGTSFIVDNDAEDPENIQRPYIQERNLSSQIIQKNRPSTSGASPRVILEHDQLQLKTYHVSLSDDIIKLVKPEPTSLAEFAERSFRVPKIIGLWSDHHIITEGAKKKHQNYIKKLAQCFSFPMDSKRLIHYLHLRFFDKMIHGRLNRTSTSHEDREDVIAKNKEVFPLATRSDPFPLPSRNIQTDRTLASGGDLISNLLTSRSDSIIDYHVAQGDILGFSEMLGARKNSHKMRADLDPFTETGSEKLGETRDGSSYLEEFIDVRLLSSRALLQAVHECFQEYQRFYSEYFEITDSMLLCFGCIDKPRKSSVAKENEEERVLFYDDPYPLQTLRMVTPVSLRNFCEYVIHEEKDFIRDVERLRSAKRSMSAGELTRKLSQHSDIAIFEVTTFTEDDFILPNSLKGKARRKNFESKTSNEIDMPPKKIDARASKSGVDDKMKKAKSSGKKHTREKSLTSMTAANSHDDSMTVHKRPSLRCARDDEPYKFIGYDIGKFRVHLTTRSETFASPDGTLVKVDLDEWLYGKRFLGIGIDLQGCFLKVQRSIGYQENQNLPFHLTTNNGIVMAFSQISEVEESSNLEEGPSCVAFEFGASWPSGLLMEVVRGDSFENPFYIQQRYVSKGSECGNVSRESYRKFLRNGTVLKFLSDNEIEVLRPNSTIVRCFEYDKFSRDFGSRSNANFSKEEFFKSPSTKYPMSTRGKGKSSSPKKSTGKNVEAERTRKSLNVTSSVDPSFGEIYSSKEDAARVKITRYTAAEHDGRRYEVENDEVSRVYDRSLVRTSTDVEACEKFTRRDDGTESVLDSRGELFVSFPDGTRIITGYMIEEEPLLCDWSDDEFTRFFASDLDVNLSQRQNDEAISSRLSNVTRTDSYRSEFHKPTNRDDRVGILLSGAFVSVLLTCRIEHECYATVAYEPIKNSCQLSMPDEVEIQISREGFFDIGVGQDTELSIRDDKLTFSSKMCAHGRSVSVYNLRETKLDDEANQNSETFLVTTDSLGKTFKVKFDGTVIHDNHSPSNPLKKAHRLFAVNRDLMGFEYSHKSERDDYLGRINAKEKSESTFIPILAKGLPEYRLFVNLLEPINYSKKWLQKVTPIHKRNRDSVNFSRSTYGNPYDWIFPFGKRKKRKSNAEKWIVENKNKVLTLNILMGIANEGDRFLDEVEKAIVHCRKMTNNVFDEYRCLDDESLTSTPTKEIEKCLENLSLGIEINIEAIEYLRDLSTKIIDDKSGQIDEFLKCSKQKQRAPVKTEEIQWYERCFRERIILPYFKTIQGSCFLWITSCVDRALQLVE